MKFEQMQYARPDFDAARETFASLRARIAAAPDAQAQLEAFREFETLSRHISTMSTLAETVSYTHLTLPTILLV